MKKLMLTALGAAALALTACGDMPPEAPAGSDWDTLQGQTFELRLRGDNAEGYGAVLLLVAALEVTDGCTRRLPVRLVARTVDLTAKDHAHLVGTFLVPEGVEQVQVSLTFDDFGGWEQGLRGGALDTRVAPLRFTAPVDSLTKRGRAVVQLDVGQSLLPVTDESRLLLPNLTVNY